MNSKIVKWFRGLLQSPVYKLIFCVLLACSGCMNLYTRCPGTDKEIYTTYQCTQEMWGWTIITAFPQVMAPDAEGLMAINLISIPLAIIPAADTCLEAVVDTVCYPYDVTQGKPTKEKQ